MRQRTSVGTGLVLGCRALLRWAPHVPSRGGGAHLAAAQAAHDDPDLFELPAGLLELTAIRELCLRGCTRLVCPSDSAGTYRLSLGALVNLKSVQLDACDALEASSQVLSFSGCAALTKLPDLTKYKNLKEIDMRGCSHRGAAWW